MKPSGIEWIGDIPDDWEVYRLKNEVVFVNGYAFDGSELHQDKEVPVIRIGDISSGVIDYSSTLKTNVKSGLSEYELRKNDILIAMSGATTGKTAIVKTNEKAYINQRVGIIRATKCNIFIKYLLETKGFFNYIFLVAGGSAQPNISMHNILNFQIPKIRLDTQQKIADYLDEKCGEIDATIAKQKEIIEKLKAYKQSLISETVTKGLDKSAPLKPSGIDYLGDIPAHWEVKRIKDLFSFGKGLPISKEDLIENGVPVINYGQIHSKDNNGTSIKDSLIRYVDLNYKNTNMTSLVESGDFIFADTSEDLDGCGNCIYVDSKYPIFAGYHCIILRSIKRNSSKYLAYLFQMDAWRTQIRRDVTGVKVFSISKKILGKSYILFPPRYEQECIVNYLQEKCNEIDVIINKKQNIIQKLDAYKKSLIFECVTGKFVI